MGVNSLPNTVTRQRRDCDLNPSPSAPESSTVTTRLPSHPLRILKLGKLMQVCTLGYFSSSPAQASLYRQCLLHSTCTQWWV